MLADELAAVADELVCSFLLSGFIVPGTGEGHFHGSGGADGASAEEEGGVTGNDFSVGECADVADLGIFSGEVAVVDHLVELETGSNTGEVTAFIDGSECVVVVVKTLGVSLGAGGVAELNFRELLGGLNDIVFVTEAVGKDDVAAGVGQLSGGLVAGLILRNVGLENGLNAEGLAGFLGSVHEVEVIGGVLVVQEDKADLESGKIRGGLVLGGVVRGLAAFGSVVLLGGGRVGIAAGAQRKHHSESKQKCNKLFHSSISS